MKLLKPHGSISINYINYFYETDNKELSNTNF